MVESGQIFRRRLEPQVRTSLQDTRAVAITGPRQSGKSTLMNHLLDPMPDSRLVTLDDPTTLQLAINDPITFLDFDGTLAIDEVQRAPELFLPLKMAVDNSQRPGHFLLTGSSHLSTIRQLSQALVGRITFKQLLPLSEVEVRDSPGTFLERIAAGDIDLSRTSSDTRRDYIDIAIRGGFPEVVKRAPDRRTEWFDNYLNTLVARDLADVSRIRYFREIPMLLRSLAAATGTNPSVRNLSSDSGIPKSTVFNYLDLLESIFLIQRVPAWSKNLRKQALSSPRVHFVDSGLVAHLTGVTEHTASSSRSIGPLLESLVVNEIRRQLTWQPNPPRLFHYRTPEGHEVDCVLELPNGQVMALEVKSAATVGPRDFRALKRLADDLKDTFRVGAILYSGSQPHRIGPNMYALPISALWDW